MWLENVKMYMGRAFEKELKIDQIGLPVNGERNEDKDQQLTFPS